MSFFADRFGLSKKLRQVRNRRSSQPASKSRPKLELQMLEDRVVPAVTAILNGSTLNIGFGAASDTATITTDGSGNIIVNGTGLTNATNPATSITQITATGLGNSTAGSLNFGNTSPISANVNSTGVNTVIINGPLNSTTLSINATDISSNTNGTITVASGGLADFNNTDTASTLFGAISGAGGVSHEGTGILALAASNSYQAGTTINAGTVTSTSSLSLGSGPVFEAGGTLSAQGSSPYSNPVNVLAGSTATTNVIASSPVTMGPLSMGAGSTLNVTGSNPTLSGFGGNGTGWTANGGATVTGDVLSTTTQVNNEARSFWYNNQLPVSSFNVSFDYTVPSGAGGADGTAFVIQTAGLTALGGAGGSLGYNGIANPSVAVEFNVYSPNTVGYKFSANGVTGGYTAISSTSGTLTGSPINLVSGSATHVNLNYDGSVLTMTLTDNSGDRFITTNTLSIASALNGATNAYFGFTGGTGGANSLQTVSNFIDTGGGTPPTNYGLSFSGTNIAGTSTINVASATFGPGALNLGSLSDGGTAATLNLNASGTSSISIPSAATGIVNGTAVAVGTGSVNLGASGALGSLAAVSVASGASIVLGASETFGSLSGAGNVALNGSSLTDGSTNNLSSTFTGTITDGGAGGGGLTKDGTGILTVTGLNTYTGPTTILAGVLSVPTIANGGVASTLGESSNAASDLVFGGGGTLAYTGPAASTDRGFTINSGVTATISNTNPLTLTGSSAATSGALTKVGAGVLTIAGGEAYTGVTSVNAGTLNLTSSLAGAVSDAATLNTGPTATISGGLTTTGTAVVNPGGTLAQGVLSLGGPLVGVSTSTFNFDYISSSNIDKINAGSNSVTAGSAKINVSGSGVVAGTYTLIATTGTITGTFTPGTFPTNANFSYSLVNTPGVGVQLVVASNVASLVWDLAGSGTTPSAATDGGGTWQQGSTTFFNVGPGGAKTWDNAQNFDVTFGSGGAGGIVTLGSAIRTGGNLIFGAVTAPYTLQGTSANNLTLVGGVLAGSNATINAPTVLAPTGTGTVQSSWFVSSGVTLTQSGNLSQTGTVGLTKSGGGTLLLSDASATYTGGTTISAGTIKLGADNVLPISGTSGTTGNGIVNIPNGGALDLAGHSQTINNITGAIGGNLNIDGGTLTLNGTSNVTFSGTITGGGTINREGTSGILNLKGSTTTNGFNGTINLDNGGGLAGGAANVFGAGATINVGNQATLTATAANAFAGDTINLMSGGSLTGNGFNGATIVYMDTDDSNPPSIVSPLTTSGTPANLEIKVGTFIPFAGNGVLAGSNLIVDAGTTVDLQGDTDPVSSVSLRGGSIIDSFGGGSLVDSTNYDLQSGTVSAVLAGATTAVGAVKSTSGTVTLLAAPTYAGATSVAAGVLSVPASLTSVAGPITVNGSTAILSIGASAFASGTLTVAGGGTVNGTGATVLTSTGTYELQRGIVNVVLGGSGVVANKTTSGTVTLNKVNTYTGATNIQAGTLQLGIVNAVPAGSAVVIGTSTTAGILDLNNLNETLSNLSVGGTLANEVINSFPSTTLPTLTINNSAAVTYAGVLGGGTVGGTGNLFNVVKTGAGILLLSSANTFAGSANINQGTLQLGNANALGSSSVPTSVTTVAPTATLDLNGQSVDPSEVVNLGGGTGANSLAAGVANGGTLVNNSSSADATISNLYVSGAATIGGSRRFNIRSGFIHSGTSAAPTTGTGFSLVKVGTTQDVIGVTDDADLNNISVTAGELTFENSSSTGNPTGTISVATSAEVLFTSSGTISNVKNINLATGSILGAAGAAASSIISLGGTVILNGTPTITTAAIFNLTSQLTDPVALTTGTVAGNLLETGTGVLNILGTTDNYTGTTTIGAAGSGGQVGITSAVAATAFGNSTTPVTLSSGTLTGNGALSFARNLTVPASGSVTELVTGPANAMTLSGTIDMGSSGTLNVIGAGNVTITGQVTDEVTAGFAPGLIEGDVNNNSGTLDATDPNPGNAFLDTNYNDTAIPFGGVVSFFRTGETSQETSNFGTTPTTGEGPWDNNQTWAYDGQFFVPTTTIGGVVQATTAVQFAENVDDDTLVKIDGVTLINDTQWNVVTTTGIQNLTPGWHNLDVRFANGGGGAGPNVVNSWTAGGLSANGLAPGAGFGFGVQGIGGTGQTIKPVTTAGDTTGADYLDPVDSGAGELFRHIGGGGITMSGSGQLTLANTNNNYHGQTSVNAGTLVAASNGALGDPAGPAVVSGGSLALGAGVSSLTKQAVTLTGTGSTGNAGALTTLAGASATFNGAIKAGGNFTVGAVAGTTLTLGPASTVDLQSFGINFTGAGNTIANGSIGSSTPSAANNFVGMNGSGTATLAGTNTYVGATSVTAGLLVVSSVASLGSTTGGLIVSGGTLQMNGDFSLPNDPVSIQGTGVGGIGAIETLGNDSIGTVTLAKSGTIGAGTAGKTLTINTLAMAAISDVTFAGAGNITVNTGVGNGSNPLVLAGGLNGQFYQGGAASATTVDSAGTQGTGIMADGSASDDLLNMQNSLTPFFTGLVPAVDFGSGTETTPATPPGGSNYTLDRNGSNGGSIANDPFANIAPTPGSSTDNQGEVFTGFINIPEPGTYVFTTRSDDGSRLWLDLNHNGAFSTAGTPDAGELVVDNDFSQGMTNRSGTVTLASAGLYAIRIASFNGGGGLGSQASWAETSGAHTFARVIIQPSFLFATQTPLNNVIQNGTGVVTLLGNNTYDGAMTVNSGTLEIDGSNASTQPANISNGTLAGIGSLAGPVNINAGGTLSPGTLAGSATGIFSIAGALTFALGAVPAPALSISVNSAIAGTGYDQVDVGAGGSVTVNGAALNLNIANTVNNDPPTSVYTFIDIAGGSTANGNFAGHAWGSAVTVNGNTFIVSESITNDNDSITNDVGLVRQPSNNYFVSATWATKHAGDNVTDAVLTDGQNAVFGTNAFATIQDALNAGVNATPTITAYIVDPGTYGDTTVNQAANIVLQGSAITIGSLSDTGFTGASVTIPSGTALTVGDANPQTFIGTLLGGGSVKIAGSLTVNQVNVLSGPIEISSGTLQLGDGNSIGTISSGKITIDPAGTLTFDEPPAAGTTTFTNQLAGTGTIVEMGFSNGTAIALAGTGSTFTGGLSIVGGRISIGSATSIGNPSSVTVNNGAQFSFGTATNATFSGALSISGPGFQDGNIAGGAPTGALLFTGTTNAWSGTVTLNGTATIGAYLATGTISGLLTGGTSGDTLVIGSGQDQPETLILTNNNNNWAAVTSISNNASLNIGNNNTSGVLSTNSGTVITNGPTAFLDYDRTDATTWTQNISGSGGIRIRHGGTLVLQATASNPSTNINSLDVGNGILNLTNGEIVNVAGVTDVGDNLAADNGFVASSGTVTGIINVPTGTTLTSNTLDAGNNSTAGVVAIGTINQTGGTVTLSASGSVPDNSGLRLGQYPTGTGNYNLSSGTFTIANNGVLGIAIDGTGNFIQTGGTASAFEIDVNTRASGNGTGTFVLNGGLFQLGGGGLTKDAGTANVSLGAGTLQATANSSISVPVTLTGATIIDTNGNTISDTSPISGSGPLTKIDPGVLSLIGTNSYTGGTTVTAGTIGAYNNAALGSGSVTLNGGTLTSGILAGLLQGIIANNSFDTTDANPGGGVTLNFLAGETGVEGNPAVSPWFVDPPGNQTIVYTGQFFVPTTPNSSTTAVQFAENVDDNTLIKVDGTQVDSDTQWNVATTSGILNLTPGWHNIEVRFGNGGGGAGAANNQNNGTNGQANWTATFGFGAQGIGGTGQTIAPVTTSGDLNATDYSNIIDPGDGSLFRAGAATNIPNNIILGAAGGDIDVGSSSVVTFSGTVSGAGTLSKTSSGTAILSGVNTYSGGTTINGGTLASNNAKALGTLASVTVNGGDTLSIGVSQTISALAGSGTVTLNGNNLTVGGTNNLSSTFDGVIADGGAPGGQLTKAGTGSLTLTGASTFVGTAAVSAGSLIVNGSLATSSTVALAANGILGGVGTVGTVNNLAGAVNPGSTGNPGNLNVNNLTLGPGALVLDLSNSASDSLNVVSGANITGATLSLNVGTVTQGESFTILTVPGTSGGLVGTFVGLDGTAGHNTISAGGFAFTISYTGGDGNDIVLTETGTASPSIVSTVQDGGIAYVNSTLAQHQHSMVENIVYSFATNVSLSASNFTLTGLNGTTTVPNVAVSGSGTVWTVTFTGAGVNNATHSIGDGEYSLVLNDPADGLASNTYNFFRLLGDMDGDGTVSASDFSTLVGTFLRATNDPLYLGADDFDGDHLIGASDLSQFTSNFLKALPNTNLLH